MPQGFQNKFRYGKYLVRSAGKNTAGSWDWSGRPLIEYDALYTYRSGRRAKMLSHAGNNVALLKSGSLADQLRRRTEYLNQQIRDELTPTSGSTGTFSCTGDTGHPFATLKYRATPAYASLTYKSGTSELACTVNLSNVIPYPNFADPFGNAITDGTPSKRFTYFQWPSTGGYLLPSAPSVSNQIISNAVKNNVAAGVIASANPWKPKATLAQTILELMSGDVPSVLRNLRRYIQDLQSLKRTAGSDWLNVQFGWVPLVNDIRDTVETLFKLHMLLHGSDSFRRSRGSDIGSWARIADTAYSRVLSVGSPLDNSTQSSPMVKYWSGTGTVNLAPPPIPAGVGKWSRSCRVEADFRFSAKYHRGASPNGRERSYVERATELLGLELTPAVLWELAPWTWLLDWGSNLGSVAANISLLDWSNVLLDYAYLTFVVKTTGSVIWEGPTVLNSTTTLSHGFIGHGYYLEEKVREQASPYGFGVSWDGLSPFQLSILTALGMSRGR